MKKINLKTLVKIIILVSIIGLWTISAINIYGYLLRANKVSEELVEAYRPQLNIGSVKKAVEILEK